MRIFLALPEHEPKAPDMVQMQSHEINDFTRSDTSLGWYWFVRRYIKICRSRLSNTNQLRCIKELKSNSANLNVVNQCH